MLAVCRKKVEAAGLSSRCDLHEGFLDSLAPAPAFDAATSILVSQFLVDAARRRTFFKQIAGRLRPGGRLVSADLASPPGFDSLLEVWMRAHGGSGRPQGWGTDVAVSPPREIESIIESAGFTRPTLFYQALFIHAWYAEARHEA